MKKSLLSVILLIKITISGAAQESISGVVFLDQNGDGKLNRSEQRLSDIPLSNGDTIVFTDSRGSFTLPISEDGSFFPILPSHLSTPKGGVQNFNSSDYYQTSSGKIRIPLVSREPEKEFRVAAIGDIQVDNIKEFGFAWESIFKELIDRKDIDFNIILGDLVNDKPTLMPVMKWAIDSLSAESWIVIGNHDLDKEKSFEKYFGAANYAFERGNVCFVSLNNFDHNKSHYTPSQLSFVKNIAERVLKGKTLVISQHIPLKSVRNRDKLLEIIPDDVNLLILTAHSHVIERTIWSDNILEIGCGAPCGSWWRGNIGADGIPVATMQCGSPRNYFVIDFDEDGSYQAQFKAIGYDSSYQFNNWSPAGVTPYELVIFDPLLFPDGVVYDCSKGTQSVNIESEPLGFEELSDSSVIVNLFGGGEDTIILMRRQGEDFEILEKANLIDLSVSEIRQDNYESGYRARDSRKIPLRKLPSKHIWKSK